ncbi:CaiB/BaiF CoA transferase family protein [Bacillus massiliigorillae]|uniref:CaiB/BaiF CoA transferase family protein n=1 Tax=Bacillus massiliigorillae TaxID=1243664 RepID=UPI00039D7443|nr:CaiB/BaiF CoA-transferase family protein [Bacillus massiliigorillae]
MKMSQEHPKEDKDRQSVLQLNKPQGPLTGYRVLELGSTIAGPFCARLLADFGAEVIKVESPSGDPVRNMGRHADDVSLYAATILRNKRLMSVDMKTSAGQNIVRELMTKIDIVIENFRPGTLERLGLDYEDIKRDNPGLIMVRISGYGQTGPYSPRPGYGVTSEAVAGVRHMVGEPNLPPARVALAVTDQLTGVYAAFGAMLALVEREKTGKGQVIDASLFEAAFSLMEPHVPAFEQLGIVPKRVGAKLPNTAPNSLYLTKDGEYVLIAANNDAVFRRLTKAMGQPELANDSRYSTQKARSVRVDEMDEIVSAWTKEHTGKEVEAVLLEAAVPTSRVYTMADIFDDPHFREREQLIEMPHEKFGKLTVIGVAPKLSTTPGAVYQLGGEVGRDTRDVLADLLGWSEVQITDLESQNVVYSADVENVANLTRK